MACYCESFVLSLNILNRITAHYELFEAIQQMTEFLRITLSSYLAFSVTNF